MHRNSSRKVRLWLVLIVGLALAACGGDEEDGGGTTPGEDTGSTTQFDTTVSPDAGSSDGIATDSVEAPDGQVTGDTAKKPDGGVTPDGGSGAKSSTCEPCSASSACVSDTSPAAKCADHGAAGAFCAEPCSVADACVEGYVCQESDTIEGGAKVKLCLPKGEGEGPGACTCSAAAIAAALATTCWVESKDADGKVLGKCTGKRVCGANGLSPCDANKPTEEQCNGGDDDCDGETDEAGCDDGDPCTTDVCANGACSGSPATGACDDDNPCTEGETCIEGKCGGGTSKDCDDNDACTADACDKVAGCTHLSAEGECDDGDKCTTGETCKEGKCVAGETKTCDDGVLCTTDSCDATTGACLNEAGLGPCDDGDPCTTDSACGTGADGKPSCTGGKQKSCDDANPCTTDSCSDQLGCTSKANTSIEVACYSGAPNTNGVGICKAGTKKCKADGSMGACAGEVLPASKESCNDLDDDCDGKVDEACVAAKYTVDGRLISVMVDGASKSAGLHVTGGASTVAGPATAAQGSKHSIVTGFYSWFAALL